MEFFFDVDGIILDFETSFMNMIREEYVPDLPEGYLPENWELDKEFPDIDMVKAWENFINSDRFENLNCLIEKESFNRISTLYPTYLVTNIPQKLVPGRRRNLSQYDIQYNDIFPAGHYDFGIEGYPSKPEVIEKLRTEHKKVIFLDDHPTNCKDVKKRFPDADVYLMSRPHNKGAESPDWIRVDNWEIFLENVLGKADSAG